jgi:hypothetical protein
MLDRNTLNQRSSERITETGVMVFARQVSREIAKAIGFSFAGVLLIALAGAGPAAAQNTAYGTGALQSNTTGSDNSDTGGELAGRRWIP